MLAILSNSIESADRLSDSLQNYWNAQGVYTNVSLFECESEFLQAMAIHTYKSVILDCAGSPIELIQQIRIVNPACKIAVLVDDHLFAAECEMALACRRLCVEMVLSQTLNNRSLCFPKGSALCEAVFIVHNSVQKRQR